MRHIKAVPILATSSVLAVVGMVRACEAYYPSVPFGAVVMLVGAGALSSALGISAYLLARYSREFAMSEVKE